ARTGFAGFCGLSVGFASGLRSGLRSGFFTGLVAAAAGLAATGFGAGAFTSGFFANFATFALRAISIWRPGVARLVTTFCGAAGFLATRRLRVCERCGPEIISDVVVPRVTTGAGFLTEAGAGFGFLMGVLSGFTTSTGLIGSPVTESYCRP